MSRSLGLGRDCTRRHERRDAHWNAEQQAVEFGAEIGEYRGVVWVPRRGSNADCRNGPLSAASRRTTSTDPVREHRQAKAA